MTRFRLIAIGLFALAFLVRIVFLSEFSQYPTFYHLHIDQAYYDLWAKRILSEGLLGKEVFEMTPLYAYLLAFVYRFMTTDLFTVRLIQAALGALTVVYIYKLAFRLFERERVAVIAGAAAASYGAMIMYEGSIEKSFLSVFLSVTALYWLSRLEDGGAIKFLIPGALIGLLVLVRENAILLVAGMPLCFFIKWGLSSASVKRSAAFVIGAALMILPATARNYAVGGEFVPVTSGGGEVFYMAYYEGSNGYYVPPPFLKIANPFTEHEEFRQEAMRRTGRQMTRKESSDYWAAEGFKYIREEPLRQLYLVGKKFVVFWNFYETPDNENLYFMRATTAALKYTLGFGLIGPLGILGFLVSLKHWRRLLGVYAFFSVYMASILITFYISRYRIPAVPILIIFSALYLDWLYTNIRAKRLRNAAVSVLALMLLIAGVNYRIHGVEPYRSFFMTEYHKIGKSYLLDGKVEEAKQAFLKSVEADPNFADGYLDLGRIAVKERRFEDAVGYLKRVVALSPGDFRGYFSLAIAYKELGMTEEAQEMLDMAVRLNPDVWSRK